MKVEQINKALQAVRADAETKNAILNIIDTKIDEDMKVVVKEMERMENKIEELKKSQRNAYLLLLLVVMVMVLKEIF